MSKWSIEFCALADWLPIKLSAKITYEGARGAAHESHESHENIDEEELFYSVVERKGKKVILIKGDNNRYETDEKFKENVDLLRQLLTGETETLLKDQRSKGERV
ncbi:MAG: hypothetical protein DRQ47_07990 [Gammaproteobacteria bacterium]|nr:MAG: hypothetical protein DRQ47_07990 [Gammaproteobacteria bacterium]